MPHNKIIWNARILCQYFANIMLQALEVFMFRLVCLAYRLQNGAKAMVQGMSILGGQKQVPWMIRRPPPRRPLPVRHHGGLGTVSYILFDKQE